MKDNEFENIIKEKLNLIKIEPPKHIWENLEKNISSNRKRKYIYLYAISIAASIFFLFLINNIFYNNITNKDVLTINETIQNNTKKILKKGIIISKKGLIKKKLKLRKRKNTSIILNRNEENKKKYTQNIIIITKNKKILCFAKNKRDINVNYIIYNNEQEQIKKNLLQKKDRKKTKSLSFQMTSGSFNNSNTSMTSLETRFMTVLSKNAGYSDTEYSSEYNPIRKAKAKLAINIKLSIDYKINEKISLTSGISYLGFKSKGFDNDNGKLFYGSIEDVFVGENIFEGIDISSIKDISQNFTYIEIPLELKYSFISKKIFMYIKGGIGLDFLINNTANIMLKNKKNIRTKSKDIEEINMCGQLSLGINIPIYKSLYINIEPQIKHFLKDISRNKILESNKNIPSLGFGLTYKL